MSKTVAYILWLPKPEYLSSGWEGHNQTYTGLAYFQGSTICTEVQGRLPINTGNTQCCLVKGPIGARTLSTMVQG